MDKPKKYEERLMEAIGFDEADLEANQAGQYTQRQLSILKRASELALLGWVIPALLGGAGLAIFPLILMSVENFPIDTNCTLFALVGVIFGGLMVFGWRSSRISADLRERRISEAEGRVALSLIGGRYSSHILRIGDLQIPVRSEVFLAFKNGDPYRIYYAPHSKRILSVEWLRDDNLL